MNRPTDKDTRRDCWEKQLSPDQRDRIYERMQKRFKEAALLAWIAEEFGIPAPSRSALYLFPKRWKPEYETRISENILRADDTARKVLAKIGNADDAVVRQATLLVTDAAARRDFETGQKWLRVIESIAERNHDSKKLQNDSARLQRLLCSERERDALQSEISNLKSQIASLTKAADSKPSIVDPAQVADALDKHLGRKPNQAPETKNQEPPPSASLAPLR